MENDTDVLVVGAGPTGLTAAAALLRRGVRVRLIDAEERANPHSKAITLWPRALEVFGLLGTGPEIFAAGVKLNAASYYTGDRLVGRLRMRPLDGTRYPLAISLPQTETEKALRAVVEREGGRVEFGARLVSLTQGQEGAEAVLADGETIRAGWVVAADGAHSTVRQQIGVAFEGAPYEQTFVLVDGLYETGYEHNESYYVMGRTGVIVVVGLPEGRYRVFASIPPGQQLDDPVKLVEQIAADASPLPLRLVRAEGSGVFRIQRRMAASLRVGRVLLAGDAAHVHSPAGGLGLNTGVEDAYSLAWRLAGIVRGSVDEAELAAWEAERLFVAKNVIAETDLQTRMWMLQDWQARLRDVLIEVGLSSGVLENLMPRRMAQLDQVLPSASPAHGRLRPGARVPDVALGAGRHLHDLLADGAHLVLILGGDPDACLRALDLPGGHDPRDLRIAVAWSSAPYQGPDLESVDDSGDQIRGALDAPRSAVCLIRPDAVLAAAADPADPDQLERIRALIKPLLAGSPAAVAEGGDR